MASARFTSLPRRDFAGASWRIARPTRHRDGDHTPCRVRRACASAAPSVGRPIHRSHDPPCDELLDILIAVADVMRRECDERQSETSDARALRPPIGERPDGDARVVGKLLGSPEARVVGSDTKQVGDTSRRCPGSPVGRPRIGRTDRYSDSHGSGPPYAQHRTSLRLQGSTIQWSTLRISDPQAELHFGV